MYASFDIGSVDFVFMLMFLLVVLQKQLAEILFHGQHGVDANKHEALNLYRDGAAQGDASSMYNLGVLHLKVGCRSL